MSGIRQALSAYVVMESGEKRRESMSAVAVMPTPEVDEASVEDRLTNKALSIPEQARGIVVRDQAGLEQAAEMLTGVIKPLRKEAADVFDPIIKRAHEAHREALAGKAKVEKPLIEAETILKQSCKAYLDEQERIRQAEEARLRRIAQDQEREQARLAEELRLAEERALNEQIEREHAEEVERKLNALPQGTPVEVITELCNTPAPERLTVAPEMPSFVPMPVVARVAVPTGLSTTQRWKAEVTSLQLLCRAIADGKVPTHYVEANMTALNQMARANKQALNVPGVRAVPDTTIGARAR